MRVSLKWLKELVDVDLPVADLVDRLDMTGTAVEGVETIGAALEGVVVGQILVKEKHPEADTLWVTTVDVAADEPLTIVCGAQNFEAGDKVPVALVGSTLPNGMTIKKAKLRGITSHGMNCSAAELEIGSDQSGLLILAPDAPVGVPYAEYRGMSDTVVELEVTPNRPDCLSMAGVAREVAAITDRTYRHPGGTPDETGEPVAESVRVEIDDPELCPRYTARLIRNVKIGPSPDWLAERVSAAGARPISNVVDITNYVMFELGQPLHAFDASTLGETDGQAHIVVRRARAGETLTTLDGQERKLSEDMLLICDPGGPVALAGVMGGESTEVGKETVDILLEAACFDTVSVSRTSRSLGLISEASSRFERGVDPNGCAAAADRAAQLMADLCGGEVAPGIVDAYPRPAEPWTVKLRVSRANAILGTALPAEEMVGILTSMGLAVEGGPDVLDVTVPTFRPDLEREIDLVEEVLRVWGMECVEPTLPGGRERTGRLTEAQRWRERIGTTMRGAGLNETMTYAFVDPTDITRMSDELPEGEMLVELLNPMSEEQTVLRRSLAPGLLRSVSYNQRRDVADVHLYEIGATFVTSGGRKLPKEWPMLAGVLTGRWYEPSWHDPKASEKGPDSSLHGPTMQFFDGKGVIEALMVDLGVCGWSARAADIAWLQPGRSAEVLLGGEVVGWLGEVHPSVLAAFEADGPVVAFELSLDALIHAAVTVKAYEDIPRFPAVEFDVALVVDEGVTAERVEQAIVSAGGKLLDGVRLFDVYRGPGVPEGKRSLAFALSYRAPDRTLTDDEVRPQHERLLRKVRGAVGAEMRG
ncbi:MAG: phenylalanine--tRNA ligase subunit beta [Actinomycetota bacterium]|nr:phenylalanine--tRNA ligase subunit beta [Actinomycetota bacterium]